MAILRFLHLQLGQASSSEVVGFLALLVVVVVVGLLDCDNGSQQEC